MRTYDAHLAHHREEGTNMAYQDPYAYCRICILAELQVASHNPGDHIREPAARSPYKQNSSPAGSLLSEPCRRLSRPPVTCRSCGLRNNCMEHRTRDQHRHRRFYKRTASEVSCGGFLAALFGWNENIWAQNISADVKNMRPYVCIFWRDTPAAIFDMGDGCITNAKHRGQLALSEALGSSVFSEWVRHDATYGSTIRN